jgi:DNA-binding NtrC family response regulator
LARHHWDRAITIAEAACRAADARRDRILGNSLRLLRADGLIGIGRVDDAAREVAAVLSDSDGLPPSAHAEVLRVRAKLGAVQRTGWSRNVLWLQARSITDRLGTTGAKHDFVRDAANSGAGFVRTSSTGAPGFGEGDAFVHSLESAVALLSLGSAPPVLLENARQLLVQLGAVESAVVASAGSLDREMAARRDSHCFFRVSAGQGADALVLAAHPRSHRDAPIVTAVIKLVAAATELHAHRLDLARRVPLWPVEQGVARGLGVFAAPAMQQLLSTVDTVAGVAVTVLITGETGVGKEVIANEIHRRSANPNAPFVAFNCAAVPRDMLESQLFGYKRGAFTGATDNSPGIIRTASGGTLFLDEIGDMSPELQPKILRFLENGEIHPLGEGMPLKAAVRIVAATNMPLDRAVHEGRFREDLYYRLNVVHLHVPPLRERREEIPLLTSHFLALYAEEFRRVPLTMTDDALERLLLYDWPGNVRQLANELRRIVALTPGGGDLVPDMLSPEMRTARRPPVDPDIAVSADEVAIRLDQPLEDAVGQLERAMITRALEQHGGRLETAAELLGLSRKGLFLKRKRHGLD